MTRLTLAFALGASILCGCAISRTEQGGTNTNWLTRCDNDVACGEGSCECGLCTRSCDADRECADVAGASCLPKLETLGCGVREEQVCARTCDADGDCDALPSGRCEAGLCISGERPGSQPSTPDAGVFAPEKGPAHTLTLPVPGEQAWRYLDGDDAWRYVAPADPGQLYDAAYFDGQWFVLHGRTENSEKITLSEINWLSSTRDGITWETRTLTTEIYESYTQLASNGESLLLAGTRHVAELGRDGVMRIDALDQDTAPAVLVAGPGGYVIGRRDDVLRMDAQEMITPTYSQQLAQFRAGVRTERGFWLVGPFNAIASPDGATWSAAGTPCAGCGITAAAYGNGIYVAADPETLFVSSDGEHWQTHVWERATPAPGAPADEIGEDKIANVDFTGGHFTLHTQGGNTSLSSDGVTWTPQLKIPLGQIGPAPCNSRCLVAGGRLLLPPAVLPEAAPPDGAGAP